MLLRNRTVMNIMSSAKSNHRTFSTRPVKFSSGASPGHEWKIEPTTGPESATSTIIWLHGLGDTGQGWSDVARTYQRHLPTTRFRFPTAPTQPITLNHGMRMPSWFDIKSVENESRAFCEDTLEEAVSLLNFYVEEEKSLGVCANKIVVVGFSQGGTVALEYGLSNHTNQPLAGVVALSTWAPDRSDRGGDSISVPVFYGHGVDDNVVPFELGKICAERISSYPWYSGKVDFRSYSGIYHGANEEELGDVLGFLRNVLGYDSKL